MGIDPEPEVVPVGGAAQGAEVLKSACLGESGGREFFHDLWVFGPEVASEPEITRRYALVCG